MTLSSDVVNKARQFIEAQQNVVRAKQEAVRAQAVLYECRLTRQSAAIALRNAHGFELEKDQSTYLQVGDRVLQIPTTGDIRLIKIDK